VEFFSPQYRHHSTSAQRAGSIARALSIYAEGTHSGDQDRPSPASSMMI